jgi:hypothetical protein
MNFDFGGTLRRAWEITWKHKILWLFGILSAIAGGRASFSRGPSYNPNTFNPSDPNTLPRLERLFPNLTQGTLVAIALGLVCVALIVIVTIYVLHVIGRGGLIGGIQLGDSAGQVSFGQAWGAGVSHFWTVLIIGLIVAVIALVIGIASVFAAATICLTPLACIGFLLIAVLGVYTLLAQIAAVTENLSIGQALSRALSVVQLNLAPVLLLAVLLIIIEAVAGFIIGIPFVIALAPALLALAAAVGTQSSTPFGAGAIISGLCFIIWIPFALVLRGIVETWIVSAWTLAFKQLGTNRGPAVAPAAPAPLAS